MRRRAGRPRRQDVRRTPSGAPSRTGAKALGPTPEHLRHRRALVGGAADPSLAENPLGVLLARRLITEEERQAGLRFAWLYRLAIGKLTTAASDPLQPMQQPGPGPATPPLGAGRAAWLAAREADFDRARAALKEEGDGCLRAVVAFAVAQEFAAWMGTVRALTPAEARRLEDARRGLALLAAHFGLPARPAKPDRARA